jgi:hypothetical protein
LRPKPFRKLVGDNNLGLTLTTLLLVAFRRNKRKTAVADEQGSDEILGKGWCSDASLLMATTTAENTAGGFLRESGPDSDILGVLDDREHLAWRFGERLVVRSWRLDILGCVQEFVILNIKFAGNV